MVDSLTPEHRSWNMSRIRGHDTKPELQLRSLLHRSGYRFRLHDRKLPGKPDIVLLKYRTAIFVHGCFWHRHSGCKYSTTPGTRADFWNRKFSDTVIRDKANYTKLKALDWHVITVWECELNSNGEKVMEKIHKQLNRRG